MNIRVDRGSEFVNKDLQDWCHSKGMKIQMTAPYSPSQNGVAERMNRTLVELARAMLTGSQLPEFLWEQAVAHAAYIRNRSYTIANRDRTPYEAWHGNKPNVTHLREFGTPVWVLLQGQNVTRKILPKSKGRAYVGTNDASDSVLYYNAETKKILTLRNYKFLTEQKEAAEEIAVSPTREEEYEDAARRIHTRIDKDPSSEKLKEQNDSRKRKAQPEENSPRKMRAIQKDYWKLANPFSSDEEDKPDNNEESEMMILMAEARDEFQTL